MFFDIWNYIEPDLIPDDEGNRVLIKKYALVLWNHGHRELIRIISCS